MMPGRRNFDYGPIGEEGVVKFSKEIGWSEDGKTYTFEIQPLQANKHYQILIGSGFRGADGVPAKPFLVDFWTK